MKTKLLLLFILLASLSAKTIHAVNSIFPKSDAIWAIHVYDSPNDKLFIYGLFGDTIINGLEYQKLYYLNDSTLNIDENDIYVAGIRQADKKVWIQPAGFQNIWNNDEIPFPEYLLYDFSKKEGEEILFKPAFYATRISDLTPTFEGFDNIDSRTRYVERETETKYGRQIELSDSGVHAPGSIWIEGIGSSSGLFFPEVAYTVGNGSIAGCFLRCMKLKDEIRYLNEDCETCFGDYVSSGISEETTNSIQIFFNTRENAIEVNSTENVYPLTMEVISIDGKRYKSSLISENDTKISVSLLPKGIYIYKVLSGKRMQTGKLIIN